jgi:hypothetical protein
MCVHSSQGGRVGSPSHRRFGACLSRTGLCAQSTAFALVRTYAHSDLTSFTTHGWKAYGLADIQAHPDRFFSQLRGSKLDWGTLAATGI